MNRILFTIICIVGMLSFIFSKPNESSSKKPEVKTIITESQT